MVRESTVPEPARRGNSADRGDLSRRRFLRAGAAVGGGLLLTLSLPVTGRGRVEEVGVSAFEPNAFIRIGQDGKIVLTMPFVEMGQGTYTSIPMLIAEELDVALEDVLLETAPPDEARFGNGELAGVQATGGSTSIRAAWLPLRQAGATARIMLVSAAAKRWKTEPGACRTRSGHVLHVPTGRVTSYGALADTAAHMPVPEAVTLKRPEDFRLIGTPARRLDARSKVDGSAVFGIDARPPGVRFATLAQSPVFGGRVISVDDSTAKAIYGVRQIVRLEDAVAVVADHMGAARKGLAALSIEWDNGPYAELSTDGIFEDLQEAIQRRGAVAQSIGDVDRVLGDTSFVEAAYQVPFLAHATMEPMNCTVHVRQDSCEVWVGTQVAARAQAAAAEVAGLPLERVIVHNHLIGGGFGRRLEIDGVARAVQIARHVDGPVKVVWTREEDIQHDMYRPCCVYRVSARLDATGVPVTWSLRFAGSSVMARWLPAAFKGGLDPFTLEGAINLAYDFANLRVEYVQAEPRGVPTAFWRSVGASHNVFVVESFVDELAAAAGRDPLDYRLALLNESPRAKAVLELAAKEAGWGELLPARVGRGISLQSVFGTYMAQIAEVEISTDGGVRVRRVVCAVDCGTIVNPDTVRAQVEGAIVFGISATLYGQVSIEDGRVQQGNFHDYRVLRMNEMPTVDVHIVRSQEAPGGIGEPGTSAIGPAVTNAICAATGTRVRELPVNASLLRLRS